MARFPIDSEQRKTGSRARAIVHYQIDADHWVYTEAPDEEVGRDCILELSENYRWTDHRIECQIKGSRNPNALKKGETLSYALETRTIEYALGRRNAFVLFYVDIVREDVYFVCIQDAFIENKDLFDKLDGSQETVNVRIPRGNLLRSNDAALQDIARSLYFDGPGRGLTKYLQEQMTLEGL